MMRSFPLLQESSELWFRFCLHSFGTKCLFKVNLRRAAGYIYLLSGDQVKIQLGFGPGFGLFLATRFLKIELKTLFIHGILSLQSGILKSRALYNILIRSTNYALI